MPIIGSLLILYFIALIVSAVLMVMGINKLIRGLMVPWMSGFGIAIAFQLVFGLWLLGGYYIYVSLWKIM